MISAIVYASNSGYTAQYAKLLGEATGLPVNDISQMRNPQPDQQVIYLGWVMADKCVGARKAMKFFDVRAMASMKTAKTIANVGEKAAKAAGKVLPGLSALGKALAVIYGTMTALTAVGWALRCWCSCPL